MRSVWTKAVFWFVAGREPRRLRQHENAARMLLHQVANPAILGVLRALILPFRKPASAGFLFSGHRNSFSHYARGEAIRIWWPWKSLPEDLPHSKRLYNHQLICSTHATSGEENQVKGRDMRDKSIAAEIDRALRREASDGDTESVKALLDAGADVHNEVDGALWCAALGRHTDTMRALIDAGANQDIALLEAAANGMVELVKELL